ncbi:MAG: hypothetical protein ACXWC8_04150 [Limisphaerales bacterium]
MNNISKSKPKIKFEDLHFFHTAPPPKGARSYITQVAVGPDCTLWICPKGIEVSEHLWNELSTWPVQALVFHPRQKCYYINAHIYADTCRDSQLRGQLMAEFDALLNTLCRNLRGQNHASQTSSCDKAL